MKAILTYNRFDKLLREYRVGDLTNYQEQSKADPNSFIFIPNRIGPNGENDYHGGKPELGRNLIA